MKSKNKENLNPQRMATPPKKFKGLPTGLRTPPSKHLNREEASAKHDQEEHKPLPARQTRYRTPEREERSRDELSLERDQEERKDRHRGRDRRRYHDEPMEFDLAPNPEHTPDHTGASQYQTFEDYARAKDVHLHKHTHHIIHHHHALTPHNQPNTILFQHHATLLSPQLLPSQQRSRPMQWAVIESTPPMSPQPLLHRVEHRPQGLLYSPRQQSHALPPDFLQNHRMYVPTPESDGRRMLQPAFIQQMQPDLFRHHEILGEPTQQEGGLHRTRHYSHLPQLPYVHHH